VSTPSEPQPPVQPAGQKPTGTQEIPIGQPTISSNGATAVQQLPPHPAATTPAPVPPSAGPMDGPQPTGPVDFVPGLPGVGTPPPPVRPAAHAAPPTPATTPHAAPAPSAGPAWPDTLEPGEPVAAAGAKRKREPRVRAPQDRAALVGLGLVVLSLVLLELGLALDFGFEGDSYWSVVPLWSAFATVCVLLGLLVFAAFYRAGNRARSGHAWRVAAGGLVGLAVFWLLVVLPVVASDRGFVLTAALAALGGALWIGPRRKD
jgi:hypothetical protein